MPKNWIEPPEITVPEAVRKAVGGHPIVAETLVRRGLKEPAAIRAFLDPANYIPSPASELPDLVKGANRVAQAIEHKETILVWGDFDVDGQTSTTLLVEALTKLGAKFTYHVPIRATEGHGIKVSVLEKFLNKNPNISVLLTCDTGIAANEAIDFAKQNGLDVIVTDHHDLPETLPAADALIDPKRLPLEHPLASLPGVGVVYKFIEQLYFIYDRVEDCEHLLDLVALGIVADVAEQRGDTRYLLQLGLNMLRNTPRLGLQALMENAEIIPSQLDETSIGFGMGPRLNALGRLADANPIVEFLTTNDPVRAHVLAAQLEGLNERRRLLTEQITEGALAQIEQEPSLLNSAALVLAFEDWHTGVIGIVASRLVERFGKPTILLSIGPDQIARGSARSIEGVHITEAIASQKDLLLSFGGHPGAAGLALPAAEVGLFRRGLGRAVQLQLGDQPPEPQIQIDAFLTLPELSLELVDDISRIAPFGAGNPSLNFAAQNLKLISQTKIGPSKNHLRVVVADQSGQHQNVLWWNGASNPIPDTDTLFSLAFTLQATTFRGERQLQVQWLDFQLAEEVQADEQIEAQPLEIIDLRQEAHLRSKLNMLKNEGKLRIWAEGEDQAKVGGQGRRDLNEAKELAVWTTPPGPWEWQAVLEQVKPQKIYLFCVDPITDSHQVFLSRLAGMTKFALKHKGGELDIQSLATATAQRENTVKMGILWLEAKGFLQITKRDEKTYWATQDEALSASNHVEIAAEIQAMLKETQAYRAYFNNRKVFT